MKVKLLQNLVSVLNSLEDIKATIKTVNKVDYLVVEIPLLNYESEHIKKQL